jgi:hypothetical protein
MWREEVAVVLFLVAMVMSMRKRRADARVA